MGFSLCGLSLMILYIMCLLYKSHFTIVDNGKTYVNYKLLFECIAGICMSACVRVYSYM